MDHAEEYRQLLQDNGWSESHEPFWLNENLCFYDLSQTRTVILIRDEDGSVDANAYFWKFESQPLPDFIDPANVEVRRYKLHHSMNALLWHDYGDRKIVH